MRRMKALLAPYALVLSPASVRQPPRSSLAGRSPCSGRPTAQCCQRTTAIGTSPIEWTRKASPRRKMIAGDALAMDGIDDCALPAVRGLDVDFGDRRVRLRVRAENHSRPIAHRHRPTAHCAPSRTQRWRRSRSISSPTLTRRSNSRGRLRRRRFQMDATVLVLTRKGYQKAIDGKNGFVCFVDRSWSGPFDDAEYWNPKKRGPTCMNAPAARSALPVTYRVTELALAGLSKEAIVARMKESIAKKEFGAPEIGSMSYMMSKSQYLTDDGPHWHPHLMFYMPGEMNGSEWGANLPAGSAVSAEVQTFPAAAECHGRSF